MFLVICNSVVMLKKGSIILLVLALCWFLKIIEQIVSSLKVYVQQVLCLCAFWCISILIVQLFSFCVHRMQVQCFVKECL